MASWKASSSLSSAWRGDSPPAQRRALALLSGGVMERFVPADGTAAAGGLCENLHFAPRPHLPCWNLRHNSLPSASTVISVVTTLGGGGRGMSPELIKLERCFWVTYL